MENEIPYVNLPAQYEEDKQDIHACVEKVFSQGDFVGGAAIEELEQRLAEYLDVRHVIAVNSGTDALKLSMIAHGLGPGDEVITPPNSFLASASSIVQVGATPVFADVLPDQNIDPAAVAAAVTARTKAIMPVHLTGRVAAMNEIMALAEQHGLLVIEDAAQSFGSAYHGRAAGSIGHIGCFSTHPLKNFNAAGDGGFLATGDIAVAERLRRLRNHGLENRDTALEFAGVSRMDTLQAAILKMRLERLGGIIERRRRNVEQYRSLLDPAPVFHPPCMDYEFNTFHTFVVQVDDRDRLREALSRVGIGSAIHYPVPIHLQPAAEFLGCKPGQFPVTERQAGRILSLPIHQFLGPGDIDRVAGTVNGFYSKGGAGS